MSNWSKDHITPSERVPRRRASDRVRWSHLAFYLVIAVLAATGIIGVALDKIGERNTLLLAEQAAKVVHQLTLSCGI